MVAVISDEDAIMIVIDRKVPWTLELAWLVAILAELGHERAAIIIITREYLHSIVAIRGEQETSMMVECQASRKVELAISIALLLGADRELDSSITIKRIVSHLSSNSTALTTTKQTPQHTRARETIEEDQHTRPTDRPITTQQQQRDDEGTKNSNHPHPIDPTHTNTNTGTNKHHSIITRANRSILLAAAAALVVLLVSLCSLLSL